MQTQTKQTPSQATAAPLHADAAAAMAWRKRRTWFDGATDSDRANMLRTTSQYIRKQVLTTIRSAGLGHVGGDMSVTDTLVTLFEGVLRLDPEQPQWVQRDRFVLSKGHCAASIYAVLAHCGFFPAARLAHFAQDLSPLNGHPNRRKIPGIETNTGPLGHGLPFAVGCATAAQIQGSDGRTFVIVGDGELQEGSNWEAAMYAAQRGLGNLTVIVDRNRLQQGAPTAETNDLEPLADKWQAFGWETHSIDGHDHGALLQVLRMAPGQRPRAVIANTIKGKGISFMEGGVEWHHKVPSAEQFDIALEELSE